MSEIREEVEQTRAKINALLDQVVNATYMSPPTIDDLVKAGKVSFSLEAGVGYPGWVKLKEGEGAMVSVRTDSPHLQYMPGLPGATFAHPEHGTWKIADDGALIKVG